jgi:hypothetical protein
VSAAPAGRTRVLVSIDDRSEALAVVERLRAAGLEEDQVMAALGTVTGSIDPARVDALRAVEGVAEVEPAREHQLPPPDADLQ